MLNASRVDADRVMLLLIDVQAKLVPLIEDHQEVVAGVRRLLRGAEIFDVPVLATVAMKGGGFIVDVRQRNDVELVRVHAGNRDSLVNELVEQIRARANG